MPTPTVDMALELPGSRYAWRYVGQWDPNNPDPLLINGNDLGSKTAVFEISDTGVYDFGAGNVNLTAGDLIWFSGTEWKVISSTSAGPGYTAVADETARKAQTGLLVSHRTYQIDVGAVYTFIGPSGQEANDAAWVTGAIPADLMSYKGSYNPSTHSPALTNAGGNNGDTYFVADGLTGSPNFGAGAIAITGPGLLVHNGSVFVWHAMIGQDLSLTATQITNTGDANYSTHGLVNGTNLESLRLSRSRYVALSGTGTLYPGYRYSLTPGGTYALSGTGLVTGDVIEFFLTSGGATTVTGVTGINVGLQLYRVRWTGSSWTFVSGSPSASFFTAAADKATRLALTNLPHGSQVLQNSTNVVYIWDNVLSGWQPLSYFGSVSWLPAVGEAFEGLVLYVQNTGDMYVLLAGAWVQII